MLPLQGIKPGLLSPKADKLPLYHPSPFHDIYFKKYCSEFWVREKERERGLIGYVCAV
jgi:hypothetical protein